MSKELDFSKPEQLQMRGGFEFHILATDIAGGYPVLLKAKGDKGWNIVTVDKRGREFATGDSPNDLIPKPARVTGWVNVYDKTNFCTTQQEAKEHTVSGLRCLGQIYIDAEIQP